MQTITEVRDRVAANARPLIDSAIEKTGPVLASVMERAIGAVEHIDPESSNREAYFKSKEQPEASGDASVSSPQEGEGDAAQEESKAAAQPQSSDTVAVANNNQVQVL